MSNYKFNNNKVIVIHKGPAKNGQNWNFGTFLKGPLEQFKKENLNIQSNNDISSINKNIIEEIYEEEDNYDNYLDEMTIIYEMSLKDNKISNEFINRVKNKWGETISEKKIFGETFVKNNKNRCKIIINGKEKKLCSYFDNENLNLINGKLEIKLKRISKIKYSSFMLCGCISLISLPHISKWNTGNVNNMKSMFFLCHKLKNISNISISQKKMKKL